VYSRTSVRIRRSSHETVGPPRGVCATESGSITSPILRLVAIVPLCPTLSNERVRLAFDSPVRITTELRDVIQAAARSEFAPLQSEHAAFQST
jgi:hypothetical protein